MIVVTGGSGFIGHNLVNKLTKKNNDIVIIDNHEPIYVINNNIKYLNTIDSYLWFGFNSHKIEIIYHLGAHTDTTEDNFSIFNEYNLNYSKFIWNFCTDNKIPLIYTSSAATYGDGGNDFDDEMVIGGLRPLNAYGQSKHDFDCYAVGCTIGDTVFRGDGKPYHPPLWVGFKLFNVYGNYEKHKNKMASIIYQFYNQIKETGCVKLFRSYKFNYYDGEQGRDFIHVDDVVNILTYANNNNFNSGLYNLGTGKVNSFNRLARIMFNKLNITEKKSYIDMPIEIRENFQYYTKAKTNKLMKNLLNYKFISLQQGISNYIDELEDENS